MLKQYIWEEEKNNFKTTDEIIMYLKKLQYMLEMIKDDSYIICTRKKSLNTLGKLVIGKQIKFQTT